MKNSVQRQSFKLADALMAMEPLTSRSVFRAILKFLRGCSDELTEAPYAAYGLGHFVDLREEDYPLDFASFKQAEANHFRTVVRRRKSGSANSLAEFLRDTLEQILVVESDKRCSRCESDGMGIFKNKADGRLALQCKHCGFGEYFDGARVKPGELTTATAVDLRTAHLIPDTAPPLKTG